MTTTYQPQESALVYLQAVKHFATTNYFPFTIKVAAYPVERIRLLMQTQHTNNSLNGSSIRSLRGAVGHITTEGSLLAPWKGVTPTLVRWLPSQYLVLFLKDMLSGWLPNYNKEDSYMKYIGGKLGSGAATGIISALVWAYPLDVMRQQLATKNSGSWKAAASQIYAANGLRGFYRGFAIDAPGLMIFRGVQLGGWDLVKDHYGKEWDTKSRVSKLVTAKQSL
eukprot:TRINITY_DN5236_c4_g1_i2.p1 TRINITY_DN5236_c4_g1~~TRINITY_DN5236_c4_g1_i2.p1  ORF type:complete len:223 (+),score=34.18 TRINITY_DN5236_c4_g1_i2:122-790(+)